VVDEVGVVGDESLLRPLTGPCRCVPAGSTLLESFARTLRLFPEDRHILLVPGDLPMLQSSMVVDFLRRCEALPPADVYLPMIAKEHFRPPFDGVRKYMSPFQDGLMCHGNLAVVSPGILSAQKAMDRVEPIYAQRLSPIRAALALGPLGLVYLFGVHFFHRLSLERFAALASRHFGLRMLPVECSYPEVAVDIDEEADYRVACQVLGEPRPGSKAASLEEPFGFSFG
jgi:hypothetical protein